MRLEAGDLVWPQVSSLWYLVLHMPATERFTRRDVLRIVGITPRQLGHWERLQLVLPHAPAEEKLYTFADLISLRTIKQLTEQGVRAARLRHAMQALGRQLAQVEVPLMELRILSNGRNIAVEYGGRTLEPLSGQFLFNFGASALDEKVRTMPERTAEEWFALALDCEGNPELRPQAVEAYRHAIGQAPDWFEAHINLGTVLYEQGELVQAAERFRCAVALAPDNALAHFNLGCVLDELKAFEAACRHLREAVRLEPDYADAHYNLARVCEQLDACQEALPHWRRYLELDPDSPWATYARERLAGDFATAHQPADHGNEVRRGGSRTAPTKTRRLNPGPEIHPPITLNSVEE